MAWEAYTKPESVIPKKLHIPIVSVYKKGILRLNRIFIEKYKLTEHDYRYAFIYVDILSEHFAMVFGYEDADNKITTHGHLPNSNHKPFRMSVHTEDTAGIQAYITVRKEFVDVIKPGQYTCEWDQEEKWIHVYKRLK